MWAKEWRRSCYGITCGMVVIELKLNEGDEMVVVEEVYGRPEG